MGVGDHNGPPPTDGIPNNYELWITHYELLRDLPIRWIYQQLRIIIMNGFNITPNGVNWNPSSVFSLPKYNAWRRNGGWRPQWISTTDEFANNYALWMALI